jgi:hypothetical protein
VDNEWVLKESTNRPQAGRGLVKREFLAQAIDYEDKYLDLSLIHKTNNHNMASLQ